MIGNQVDSVQMLRDHIFPAVMGRFPGFIEGDFVVSIQQDNAPAHVLSVARDEEVRNDLEALQPAQSQCSEVGNGSLGSLRWFRHCVKVCGIHGLGPIRIVYGKG